MRSPAEIREVIGQLRTLRDRNTAARRAVLTDLVRLVTATPPYADGHHADKNRAFDALKRLASESDALSYAIEVLGEHADGPAVRVGGTR